MPVPCSRTSKIVWLSVLPALFAALILFDAIFVIGASLDWALLGLYDLSPGIMLSIGFAVAAFAFYLAFRFFRLAYCADLELE